MKWNWNLFITVLVSLSIHGALMWNWSFSNKENKKEILSVMIMNHEKVDYQEDVESKQNSITTNHSEISVLQSSPTATITNTPTPTYTNTPTPTSIDTSTPLPSNTPLPIQTPTQLTKVQVNPTTIPKQNNTWILPATSSNINNSIPNEKQIPDIDNSLLNSEIGESESNNTINDSTKNTFIAGSYFKLINSQIYKHIRIDRISRFIQKEVTLEVSFQILDDGSIEEVEIVKSSGNNRIDVEVVKALTRAAPFHSLPSKYQYDSINIELPIRIKLKN